MNPTTWRKSHNTERLGKAWNGTIRSNKNLLVTWSHCTVLLPAVLGTTPLGTVFTSALVRQGTRFNCLQPPRTRCVHQGKLLTADKLIMINDCMSSIVLPSARLINNLPNSFYSGADRKYQLYVVLLFVGF